MKKALMGAVASATLTLGAGQAWGLGSFDLTNIGSAGLKRASAPGNGILAEAFVYITPGSVATYTPSLLYLRNQTDDHGLGVCSEDGATACGPASGYGDVNGLGNFGNTEVIRLTLPTGKMWKSLWVSSLDSGGAGRSE